MGIRILVDGDATPQREEIGYIAKKYHIEMIVYMDYAHYVDSDLYKVKQCSVGNDNVDQMIINDVKKDDIVITVESPYGKARYLSNSIIPEVLTEGSTILTMSLRTYNIKQAKDILEKVVYYYNELSVNEKNQALIIY